ncbi:MAG: hypothetical protein Q9187_000835 [Circinaria calcarea]
MSTLQREYELVLLGATGYTGKYCAEHIVAHLPTDLKWAVAGRSAPKLSSVLDEIKPLNPDRLHPGLEVASLTPEDLNALARKTRLLINTIGPYHRYSTPVVEACANNGTHYLDVTGETPWVWEIIKKYDQTAKSNNATIIPEIGVESAPSDLLAFSLASLIREKLSAGTREVVASVQLKSQASGGTLATVLGILDHYSLRHISDSSKAWAMSPVPHTEPTLSISLATKIFGVRSIADLGVLTTNLGSGPNVAIVQRTWGLLDQGNFYGQHFQYSEYMRVRNLFVGFAVHLAIAFGKVALSIPPIRWLLKKCVYKPGEGPTKEAAKRSFIEYRAIATADTQSRTRAFARVRWNGSLYSLTGVLLAEAAILVLRDRATAKNLGGGLLTPAMLGQPFIDRLKRVGLIFETYIMDSSI